jgi:dipeptidyl aminopeptidase/acylaminoacyl peptidase
VDVDGSNFLWLVARGSEDLTQGTVVTRPLRATHRLATLLRDGSDEVVVLRANVFGNRSDFSWSPLRLNTRTRGTRSLVSDEPRNAADWVFNAQGDALAVRSVDADGLATVWWRADAAAPWAALDRYDIFNAAGTGLAPLAVAPDGQLLVTARRNDAARTAALYRYDPRKRQLESEALVGLKDYDFTGNLIFDRTSGALVGAPYATDAFGVAWLDAGLREVQRRIDELLPATANTFGCDPCGGQRRFLVRSWSDRQAPVYFLFDREVPGRAALSLVGPSMPAMDASQMAEQDFQRVPARDGRSIPVYVTKPKGKGPWPAVVLVHGGPWVRGVTWGWNADSQFLASRGYLVVEPEFRGSLGYGDAWHRAGFKQWGLAMQDDVTDATRWAVAQGLADPRRLVIAGASYGGYAAMMGLVKEPDLYRAGINWVGVTDIDLLYTVGWSDTSGSQFQREAMPQRIGDRTRDAEQLRRTSPLLRAAEITKPVLMAYGAKDLRVPLPHGTKMRDAIKAAGKAEVVWIEYELEGHGFLLEANRVDFWTRVERFLAKHLEN